MADDEGAETHGHSRLIAFIVRGHTDSYKTDFCSQQYLLIIFNKEAEGTVVMIDNSPCSPWLFCIIIFL